ncbi:hypothetical protein L6164_001709 [Bauhinia variegata]|uniref:Uncharacterized protein n=1 Tax=Bauhinia variegata TaxID=167791 RepID=A0ACB9QAL3_BAUVA|nr:hypothetical protein L6164_001709 [Bauhinia variegata]
MASVSILAFLIFSQLVILLSAQNPNCPISFHCGDLGTIQFPFADAQHRDCGLLVIHGCDSNDPSALKYIQFDNAGELFQVTGVGESFVSVRDFHLQEKLLSRNCDAFTHNRSLDSLPLINSAIVAYRFDYENSSVIRCNRTVNASFLGSYDSKYTGCPGYDLYLGYGGKRYPEECSTVQIQIQNYNNIKDPFSSAAAEITVTVQVSDDCSKCHYEKEGQCRLDTNGQFFCATAEEETGKTLLVGATAVGILGCLMALAFFFKRKFSSNSAIFCWKKQDPTNPMIDEFLQTYEPLPTTTH